jgi:hypothetical protein
VAPTPLNTNRGDYIWPTSRSLVYVCPIQWRRHLVAPDPHGPNLELAHNAGIPVQVRMYCGLETTARIYVETINDWNNDVTMTKNKAQRTPLRNTVHGVGTVHGHRHVGHVGYVPNCLECDHLFNQSEISV